MTLKKDLNDGGRRAFLIQASLASAALAMKTARGAKLRASPASPRRFKQDRFVISFWVDPPADASMKKHYAQIAAANFTVVLGGFGANTPSTDTRQLDLCHKYGLKALVYLPGYEAGARYGPAKMAEIKQADQFPNHPACCGYMLMDEPAGPAAYPNLRFMVDHLRRTRPGKLAFINLLGWRGRSYEKYVDQFVRQVDPDVLCMDYYPRMQPDMDTQVKYCAILAVLRQYALLRNIPFWNFFDVMPYDSHDDLTEAQIRWQIYTSLAYGAKGVLYFCYWTPLGPDFRKDGAILTREGRPTRHYDQARRINAVLKKWGPTLMQLTSTAVYRVPRGTNPALRLKGSPLVSISPGDYLIGVFQHADGRTAVLLNNYSYAFTAWPTVQFAAALKNIVEVDPATGREVPVVDDSSAMPGLQLSLGAAGGRLFLMRQ